MTWTRRMIHTLRGEFEVFSKGDGEPLCVTHLYSEFNETGDHFADVFTTTHQVFLVNLRETGNSPKAEEPYQLSMLESVLDLEAIRETLGFRQWGFAGHSTGGMLGIIYGIFFSDHLTFEVIVGAAAREYMTFSPACIYHSSHPRFNRMQELNELLKRTDLLPEQKKQLKVERTKLSLVEPEKYFELFSSTINKGFSALRIDYFSRELQIFDVTKKLPLISAPVWIACGRHDVQCPVEYSI